MVFGVGDVHNQRHKRSNKRMCEKACGSCSWLRGFKWQEEDNLLRASKGLRLELGMEGKREAENIEIVGKLTTKLVREALNEVLEVTDLRVAQHPTFPNDFVTCFRW
jgi:hypothetical protein